MVSSLGKFLVVFITIFLLGFGIGWVYNKYYKIPSNGIKTEESANNQFSNEMKDIIGPNWESYITPQPMGARMITLVTDGVPLKEVIPITASNNEEISKSVVALRGYYLDQQGNRQSIIVPVLLELPGGRYFIPQNKVHSKTNWEVKWTQRDIDEILNSPSKLKEFFSLGEKGLLVKVTIIKDIEEVKRNIKGKEPTLPNIWLLLFSQIEKYNTNSKELLDRFFTTGDPSIKIIVPFTLPTTSDIYATY